MTIKERLKQLKALFRGMPGTSKVVEELKVELTKLETHTNISVAQAQALYGNHISFSNAVRAHSKGKVKFNTVSYMVSGDSAGSNIANFMFRFEISKECTCDMSFDSTCRCGVIVG